MSDEHPDTAAYRDERRKEFERAILARLEATSDHMYQWPRWAASYEASMAVVPILNRLLAEAWDKGHRTPKRLGPDGCRCAAYNEDECGCGRYGTNVITPNPYR